jgi:uncharacterized RDD family membrane protein YckC
VLFDFSAINGVFSPMNDTIRNIPYRKPFKVIALSKSDKNQHVSEHSIENENSFQRASFFRRFAAIIYDVLVATAVGMCAGLVIHIIMLILFETNILPNQGFENYMDLLTQSSTLKLVANTWIGFWITVFFLWFWKNGGQTLGMRAWRLKIFNLRDETTIGYPRLMLRMVSSLLGIGTLLVLLDFKNKQSLQDRIAQTEVLFLSKEENDHKSW